MHLSRKVSRGSNMKPFKIVVALALAATTYLAHAVPLHSTASGFANSNVHVFLPDSDPFGVKAITILITFDSRYLDFVVGAADTLVPPPDDYDSSNIPPVNVEGLDPSDPIFNLDPTDPAYIAFLDKSFDPLHSFVASASYPAPLGSHDPNDPYATFFDLTFFIKDGTPAGTLTEVVFTCLDFVIPDPADPDKPTGSCVDFDFNEVSATVTVLADTTTPMPLPGTLPLLGLGLGALMWARRRQM